MTEESTSGRVSRRKFLAAAGSVGAVGLAGCTQSGSGGGENGSDGLSGTIDIAGSSTVFPLATAMAERFQSEHSDVNINIQSTGSGGGFANHFCPGRTDFNNASRPIQPEEEQACSENGITPVELTVATDALTVVVNNEADWVDCITVEELREIWSADSPPTTWSDVNSDWPDQELELYGPTDASGTYDYFIESIIGEEGSHRQDYSATEQDRTIIQGVQGSPYAIGYLGFAYYSENTESVTAVPIDDGDGPVALDRDGEWGVGVDRPPLGGRREGGDRDDGDASAGFEDGTARGGGVAVASHRRRDDDAVGTDRPQALVTDLSERYEDLATPDGTDGCMRREVLDENKWRALRYGHAASFIERGGSGTVDLGEVVDRECDRLGVSGIRDVYDADSGATRQRRILESEGLDALCRDLLL